MQERYHVTKHESMHETSKQVEKKCKKWQEKVNKVCQTKLRKNYGSDNI